jgi:hypothetical protein
VESLSYVAIIGVYHETTNITFTLIKLVIDKALNTLPRRQTDGAIVVRSQDAPNAKARVFKLNVNVSPQPVMLER